MLLWSSVITFAIARGYSSTDKELRLGMVVSLSIASPDDSKNVERAHSDNSERVVGVVTTIGTNTITVSSANAQVIVENEGQVEAYVSDINGTVAQGDLLILSPLRGILMKSDDAANTVIGIAADIPKEQEVYTYEKNNQPLDTKISKVKVNLNNQGSKSDLMEKESTLATLGRTLVGKEVEEVRVLVALVIFVVVLITEGAILYGAISSAIVAIGRNPLTRKAIRNELLRVVVIAILVLVVGLGAVYVIIWI